MLALDHAIVLVRDLDAAALAYRRLGFSLTPRGRHSALGTANHTIMFGRDYLELMAVTDPRPDNHHWSAFLADREGLATVALAMGDARAHEAALRERGIEVGSPVEVSRTVSLQSGAVEARFTLLFPAEAASPAIPMFFCHHHTPAHVWLPEYLRHPNTARGIGGLLIVVQDPDQHAPAYERLLGAARVHPRPGGLTLTLRTTRIWIVRPEYVEFRLGRSLYQRLGPLGMTVTVSSLTRAKEILVTGAVPYRVFGERSVLIEPTFTRGVFLELVEA